MRVIRRIRLLSLLIAATLFVQNASATLMLPDSSYLDGAWQGSLIHEEPGFNVLIDFAVYDTFGGGNEFVNAGFEAPGTGQYIYSYQLFNHRDAYEEVAYFGILDIDGVPIDEASLINGTSAQSDSPDEPSEAGIAPKDPSPKEGVWVWEFDGGYISTGEHSWFLVFSSDFAPVAGRYEIRAPEEEEDVLLVPEVPEPTTLVLLGVGSAMLLRRRRKAV